MPEFGKAFSGLACKRKLTHSELVRAIRFMVAAEYEAIQLYEQLAESTDNALARKVLEDITHEEMEHVGEFVRLLKELAPQDVPFYREGCAETEQAMEELGCSAGQCCHHEPCCREGESADCHHEPCEKAQQGDETKICAREDSK